VSEELGTPAPDEPDPPEPLPVPPAAGLEERHGRRRATALGGLLVLMGLLWLLASTDLVDLSFTAAVGLLLIGLGGAIALDAGHPHGAVVALGVALALAGAAATALDVDLVQGGVGERIVTPASAGELGDEVRLGVGKLLVDLTDPRLAGGPVDVEASVGIGQLLIRVPADANVEVDGHAALGNVHLFGNDTGGFDVDRAVTVPGGGAHIVVDANVGIGEVRVERGF
jgi:hypothetical protein